MTESPVEASILSNCVAKCLKGEKITLAKKYKSKLPKLSK